MGSRIRGCVLCACAVAALVSSAYALDLVADGKPACTIVLPAKSTYWEQVAARWIQTYVQKATGAKLVVVSEARAPKGTVISVGHTDMAKRAGVGTDDLKYDGCKMVVKGRTLFLIGRDTPGLTRNSTGYAAGAHGTCRAATKFLEDFLGIRWLVPSTEGTLIPPRKGISVPDNLKVAFNPAMAFTTGRPIYGYGTPGEIANNYRCPLLMKSYGGHSYYDWVPKEKYFKTHPDYFWMDKNGKRQKSYNHLCTSSPGVRELFRKSLFALFDQGYDCVQLGQTDGYRRCQCPQCEAMDKFGMIEDGKVTIPPDIKPHQYYDLIADYPPERLHLAHKWLIDEAAKRYPNKTVKLIVYGPTTAPSKKIDYFGDNVILEICGNANPDLIKLWKGKAAGFCTYVIWFDISYLDIDAGMSPAMMAQRIRQLLDSGCLGIHFGGGGEGNWGYMGPTYYVLGRLMGDPGLSEKALVKEYCDGLYGRGSQEMQDFFDLALSRLHFPTSSGMSAEDKLLLRYPPKLLLALDELLSKAELKADTERNRSFIRMSRDQFEYNRRVVATILAYRNWKLRPTRENWDETRKAVAAFDEWRERVVRYDDRFVAKYFPSHGKFCDYITSDADTEVYWKSWGARRKKVLSRPLRGLAVGYCNPVRRPLTLSFDKPPKLGSMKARRAPRPPKLDGRLDDPAWAKADVQIVPPMTKAQPDVITKVRVAHDDTNIYLAFECDEPLMEHLVARATGRDGPLWKLDCGEILLAPDRSRRRYYHYIIAPAEDALYDDRTGFKTLDDQDASWNGPCDYAYFVDKANKRWFLEIRIPFATLGVAAPKPGEWWLANFGRERQAQLKGKHGPPELLLWSQEESLGFVDPAAFGKLVFVD